MRIRNLGIGIPDPYMSFGLAFKKAMQSRRRRAYREFSAETRQRFLWVRIIWNLMFEYRLPNDYALWLERKVDGQLAV